MYPRTVTEASIFNLTVYPLAYSAAEYFSQEKLDNPDRTARLFISNYLYKLDTNLNFCGMYVRNQKDEMNDSGQFISSSSVQPDLSWPCLYLSLAFKILSLDSNFDPVTNLFGRNIVSRKHPIKVLFSLEQLR